MNAPKVAVIGWDAATFDVILPLMQEGVLPNLQRLMAQGSWGSLASTLHPLSPTAWASFMTGKNPGKHGIFDFVGLREGGGFQVLSGGAVRAETLWSQLSSVGRRVGVINVPMTYPPEPINGFLVAGMDAPRQNRPFTYPPDLANNLIHQFGRYYVDVGVNRKFWTSAHRFTRLYTESLGDVVRRRSQVVCKLLESFTIDFLMVVFTAPDRIQHALGHLMAGGVSANDGIGHIYKACDRALGNILEKLGDDWIVLVMSDHGACAYQRVFELGTWLAGQGWLRLQPVPKLDKLAEHLTPIRRRFSRLVQRVKPKPGLQRFLNRVVWQETKAFAMGAFGSIYINDRERFPHGIVRSEETEMVCAQISEGLLSLHDPETGEKIVQAVHRSREVYEGPCVHLAPDLLIETTNEYFVRNNLDHYEGHLTYPAGRYHGRSLAHTGRHTRDGILVVSGAPFAHTEHRLAAQIVDIAPTILYLTGLPVPSSMDGKPLLDWLDPSYREAHPMSWADNLRVDHNESQEPVYNQQEAASVEARLRDLGYID